MKKLHFKPGVKTHNRFDLSRTLMSTFDFGQIVPIFVEDCVPSDVINVKMSGFCRTDALVFPTFGKADFRTLGVYVDYHQVWRGAPGWFAGLRSQFGKTTLHPNLYVNHFFQFFVNNSEISSLVTDSSQKHDVVVWVRPTNTSPYELKKYAFTSFGRYCYKVLRTLGYSFPQNLHFTATSGDQIELNEADSGYNSNKVTYPGSGYRSYLSALPLLCFVKAYYDYMIKNSAKNESLIGSFLECVYRGEAFVAGGKTIWNGSGCGTNDTLLWIFKQIKQCYASDFVTCMMPYELGYTDNGYNSSGSSVLYRNKSESTTTPEVVNLKVPQGGFPPVVGSSSLDALTLRLVNSMMQYYQRNFLYGSDAAKILKSRFGISSDVEDEWYSHFLNTTRDAIQIGDVTSLADTGENGLSLGSYAGKAIISSNGQYHYKSDSHGMFIILAWLEVKPVYDGFQKHVWRTQPVDYFTPEYDGLGVEAVTFDQLIKCDPKKTEDPGSGAANNNLVAGLVPRYATYKDGSKKSQIVGDFELVEGMDAWHFGRSLSRFFLTNTIIAQTDSLMYYDPGEIDSSRHTFSTYDRIFQNVTDYDKFYFIFNFDVNAYRPMLNASQSFELDEGDITTEIAHSNA
ncbi:major capsid protein [Capybara microvirus Cap1_SP_48]|nr:major capsid protein [Capybara microvirus Cap1_SP_48]